MKVLLSLVVLALSACMCPPTHVDATYFNASVQQATVLAKQQLAAEGVPATDDRVKEMDELAAHFAEAAEAGE